MRPEGFALDTTLRFVLAAVKSSTSHELRSNPSDLEFYFIFRIILLFKAMRPEGFEPPSVGLEPTILPDYTIAPKVYNINSYLFLKYLVMNNSLVVA